MSVGERTRTTHVWRAKNKDDEDVWVDLERVDKLVNNERQKRIIDGKVLGSHYQKVTRTMFWGDEFLEFRTEEEAEDAKAAAETEDDENPHPTRKTTFLKVENPDDETTFAPVNVIDKQRATRGRTRERQDIRKRFVNKNVQEGDDKNETREFTVRRVFHWDTEKDPNEDYVADDPDWRERQQYVRVEGTEDRSQYVDVALIERVIQYSGRGPTFQKRTFVFNTDPIKEFSEPTPEDEIDPEKTVWLDPWQNIVNVQWSGYRLVAFISAQFSDVNYSIKWAGPKTFYTLGELNRLERDGEKVQVPTFGASVSIPTDTQSANGTYPPTMPDGVTITITGDLLAAAEATGEPDYRGFTTLNEREWDEDGEIKVPTDEYVYYDFNWEPVGEDDVPEASERGAVLTSSDGVTVYVRLNTGDEATRGVTAYNTNGQVLWRIGSAGLPDAVNYNRDTELIALTYYGLPGDADGPGVEYYRLNGTRSSVIEFGSNYSTGDVSRKGKSYVFMDSESPGTTESIVGLSQSGETLWTISGESFDTGWLWGSVTAYGEDYLVVFIFKNIPDIPHSTTARSNGYRIYDAHTGEMVSETMLSDDIRTAETYDIDPPSHYGSEINQPSYGSNNGMIRSAYWP